MYCTIIHYLIFINSLFIKHKNILMGALVFMPFAGLEWNVHFFMFVC